MGGYIYVFIVFYLLLFFGVGVVVVGVYFFGVILLKWLKGRMLGGVILLGYGVGVGNGWGYFGGG